MEVRLFQQFKNYVEVADTYKQNINIYFFIKYYAFSKFCNVAGVNLNEGDRAQLEQMIVQFKKELAQAQWNYQCMTKEEYSAFLEKFYEGIDFNSADLYLLTVSKDILEILSFFGDFDDLATRRMNFFNRKILVLESQNQKANQTTTQSQSQPQTQTQKTSQNITMTTSTSSAQQSSTATSDKTANATSISQPKPKATLQPTSSAVSAGKDSIHDDKQCSSSDDYIPKMIDKSIKLPLRKTDPSFNKVKELISMHMEYSNLELDFHKLENAKDHIEAAIYYLRNIEN